MVCESACLLVYVTKMYLHNRRRTLEDFKMKKKQKKKTQTLRRWRRLLRAPNGTVFLLLWCWKDSAEEHLVLFLLIPMSDFSGTYMVYGLCWKRKHALPNLCYIHTLRNTNRLPKNVPLSQICERALLQEREKGHRCLIVTPTSASSLYI